MQRITWNGVALHGGPLPGHAASHGCVRMPYDFAEKLFNKTRMREGGVTLSVASNGGEVDWLARDLLQVSTGDALKFLNDEYLEIRDRYPGEFALMANAHALTRALFS